MMKVEFAPNGDVKIDGPTAVVAQEEGKIAVTGAEKKCLQAKEPQKTAYLYLEHLMESEILMKAPHQKPKASQSENLDLRNIPNSLNSRGCGYGL